jgi:hypothetical protein
MTPIWSTSSVIISVVFMIGQYRTLLEVFQYVFDRRGEMAQDERGEIVVNEEFISHFTGNTSVMTKGRALLEAGRFAELYVSEDGSLLFGTCEGGGEELYRCSVDFIDEAKPVPRCTCPSRQLPCKHVVGLLYARLRGKVFTSAPLPADIAEKREKARGVATGKAAASKGAAGVAPSVAKKCHAQLEGIALAEKLLHNIVLTGLTGVDGKNRVLYQEQSKELGDYYISGIEAAFDELFYRIGAGQGDFADAIRQLDYLHALLAESRSHTERKLAAQEQGELDAGVVSLEARQAARDVVRDATLHSRIEEQMGYVWKLTELAELGLFQEGARLLQVGFESLDDAAHSRWEDRGVWLSLSGVSGGAIYLTRNFKPYKAQQHIHQEDTFSSVVEADLYVYPTNDRNPRIRWKGFVTRPVTVADIETARNSGDRDFAAVIEAVKAQICRPLADKHPLFALRVARLGVNAGRGLSVFDEDDTRLPLLTDGDFAWLLERASRGQVEGSALICRFNQVADILYAVPLSLITAEEVLRFTF